MTSRRSTRSPVVAARRIDAIRITHERYEREIREQEMEKLATEAELRALRAQLNPHFLFNALTTIGHLIQTAPPRALETLLRLTALLRAVLRSEGEFTTLGREMEMVEAYLDIERARFERRLRVTLDVPPGLPALRVPPLVLQPIVENAVKHGISPQRRRRRRRRISARVDHARGAAQLVLTVTDTGAGAIRRICAADASPASGCGTSSAGSPASTATRRRWPSDTAPARHDRRDPAAGRTQRAVATHGLQGAAR